MLQKLGIAQAIMENPDVLLLDEPFNALDEDGIKTVKELIIEQKERGAAVVIASHELDVIRGECDLLFNMKDGELQQAN